jgi:pyridoxine/pyridoxamine 5'-phosphate oxidase
LEEAPSKASGVTPDRYNMRQGHVTGCLEQAELDELRAIQNAINARRPRTSELEAWMSEDSPLGEHTRESYRQYAQGEKPYRPGDFVIFGYYSLEDVRAHTAFLARLLPEVVVRFKERRYG